MKKDFPTLSTERTLLRALQVADAPEIFALRSNLANAKYLDRPIASTISEAHVFINKINRGFSNSEWIYWGISLLDQPQIIGTICLWNFSQTDNSGEIGFELLPEFQGKGLMHEVVIGILNFAFHQKKLTTVTAYVHPENKKSIRVLTRHHFLPKENSLEEYYLLSSIFLNQKKI